MAVVAQPWPNIGDVIPDAVQDVEGKPPFIYPFRYQPGDRMVQGMGTIEYALNQQLIAGALSEEQAQASAKNSGIENYTPKTIS